MMGDSQSTKVRPSESLHHSNPPFCLVLTEEMSVLRQPEEFHCQNQLVDFIKNWHNDSAGETLTEEIGRDLNLELNLNVVNKHGNIHLL